MYFPNDNKQNTPSVDWKHKLKCLDTLLNEPTNLYAIKAPKFLIERIRKSYYKTLGTGVINSPLSEYIKNLVQDPSNNISIP